MKPLVLVNLKVYPESISNSALKLVREISKVKSNKFTLAVSPSLLTTKEAAQEKLIVIAQHVDAQDLGAHTGRVTIEELAKVGVKGVMLNHSEYKIPLSEIKRILIKAKKFHLMTIVCASNLKEIKEVLPFHPDYIAYEPSELIGGPVSIVEADPKLIQQAHHLLKNSKTKLLCGAGIHSREDLQHALKLGAQGVLLAHALVKAKNPKKFLEEMLKL